MTDEKRSDEKPEDDRIAKLEAENAALKARVEALEPKPAFERQPMERYDPTASFSMPASVVAEMARAVPDSLVRAVVAEQRRSVSLPGVGPETAARGTGWSEPKPLGPYDGQKYVDAQLDVADAVDKAELAKRLLGVKP